MQTARNQEVRLQESERGRGVSGVMVIDCFPTHGCMNDQEVSTEVV